MRSWIFSMSLLASAVGAWGAAIGDEESAFELFATRREVLIAPPVKPVGSLLEAKFEPTKHELSFHEVFATEKWEQGFLIAARIPVDEAFSLRQEFRAGLQSETVLGQELAATYRDALAMMEKTVAELRAADALRLALSAQQQWLANNSIPFAEIVTYGVEVVIAPTKATTLRLAVEWLEKEEYAATVADQQNYRFALEHELVPKRLKASAGISLLHTDDQEIDDRESLAHKLETAVRWSPLEQTAFTLGAELAGEEVLAASALAERYAVKMEQRLFPGGKLELQAAFEQRARETQDVLIEGNAWNLGAHSDFALRDDLAAGLGVRYRQSRESLVLPPVEEFSLSLSLRGKF